VLTLLVLHFLTAYLKCLVPVTKEGVSVISGSAW